jgi:hypothetical protein
MLFCKGYNVYVSADGEGEAKMFSRAPAYEKQIVRKIHATPRDYWPNLLQLVRLFRESVTLQPADASFRQGWHEAMAGQTCPVSELWKGIDAE